MNSHKYTSTHHEKRDEKLTSLVNIEQMEPEAMKGEEIETNTVVMVSLRCSKQRTQMDNEIPRWEKPHGAPLFLR